MGVPSGGRAGEQAGWWTCGPVARPAGMAGGRHCGQAGMAALLILVKIFWHYSKTQFRYSTLCALTQTFFSFFYLHNLVKSTFVTVVKTCLIIAKEITKIFFKND